MAIAIPDFLDLSDESVQQAVDFINQRVSESYPTAESRRGAVREIVLYLNGVLSAAQSRVIEDQVLKSTSILLASEDPDNVDPDLIDRIAANFRVTRRAGSPARGTVTVVVSVLAPTTVAKGTVFTVNGLDFSSDDAYAARTSSSSVITETDRVITSLGGGQYGFVINVTALLPGAAGQLKRGTSLTPRSPIPNFVRSYVESDFIGGVDTDSTPQLLARLQEGLADRSSSNRATIESMIRNAAAFEQTSAVSIAGFGDPEQRRYHSILPVAFGGRIDVYARTRDLPISVTFEKTCALIETRATGAVWQFSIARDEFPGFYDVAAVTPSGETDQTGYEILEDLRGFDLTDDGSGLSPDIVNAEEAAFTRFQTATIRFLDTDTDVSGLVVGESTQAFDVVIRGMPLIADLQDFLADRSRRPAGSDIVTRAPVPCFLDLSLVVYKKSGETDPDIGSIKVDLATYVNSVGFTGRLYASALSHIIHRHLVGDQTASAVDMYGRIQRPDRSVLTLRSDEVLIIPNDSVRMVTARTVLFVSDPDRIAVSVQTI